MSKPGTADVAIDWSKDAKAAMDSINEVNIYATYLNESSLSVIDEYIDTGSMVLNAIISGSLYGGIPGGRVTLLAGESMVGKSLFVLKILANAQKMGKIPVIFDTENAIDPEGAARLGLDISKVKYVPCVTIEQTRNSIYKFLTEVQAKGLHNKFIIAIDSLGNLQSELELKRMGNENTSQDMGTKARAMKSLMQMCTNMAAQTKTTMVMTNHIYDDPAAMYPSIEKNMPGGKSVIYLPSVTVQLGRKPMKDDGGKTIKNDLAVAQKNFSGIVIKALTRKNRLIKQYLEAEMYLSFATGLNKYYGLLDLLVGMGVVIQTGATYTMPNGDKMGYYKNWQKDKNLWDTYLLPTLESKLKEHWSYGNNVVEDEDLAELEDIAEEAEAE